MARDLELDVTWGENMNARHLLRTLLLVCSLASAAWLPLRAGAQTAAACDRACLKGIVDDYFTALAARDHQRLPLADNVKFTENGRVLELGEGFWKTAGKPHAYRDYILDPETGGAAALTALDEYDGIAQMFVRLKIAQRRITEIETIVARVGDQRWFAPETLPTLSDIFAQPVPVNERHSRAELVAAADAYFTAVQTEGTPDFVQAPFDPKLKRFENGQQTTNVTSNPVLERHTWTPILQLERAQYKGTIVTDRRYPLVDVEHGIALAVATFRREGEHTSTLLLAEIFKFTGGQLREIRAVILNLPNGAGTGWTAP
jgi:hypothetical protein